MYADPSKAERIEARVERIPESGCWIWLGTISKRTGYGQLSIRCKTTSAHRVAYEAFVGEIPAGMQVCHRCDVRCCVSPAHLFLGTSADNLADMSRKGRSCRGAKNPRAKLTAGDVALIRMSLLSQRALATMFRVGQSQIQRIRSGQGWAG